MKKFLDILTSIILIAVLAVLVSVLYQKFTGGEGEIFGLRLLRVVTDSMEPEIKVGDIVLVKAASAEDVQIDDTVVYRAETGPLAGQLITHKLKTKTKNADRSYTLQTQGVKAGAPMDEPISGSQIVGRVLCILHILTFIYSLFITKWGLAIVLVPTLILIVSEIRRICKNVREDKINA